MKRIILIFFITAGLTDLSAQVISKLEKLGNVSFITSQNIYVRFENTEGIAIDDTLYISAKEILKPSIIVKFISTTSCSGIAINNYQLKVGDQVKTFAKLTDSAKPVTEKVEKQNLLQGTITEDKDVAVTVTPYYTKKIRGNFAVSSYSNLSNSNGAPDFQNWRYSFSMDADSLFRSPLSFTSYINFSYRADRWNDIQKNIGDALKVYDLSINYKISAKTNIILGRKINIRTSSLGAIDGLQLETSISNFVIGAIAGSRPSFTDYGYDIKMFEYGGYLFRSDTLGNASMQNTVGIFQQTNNFKTDRRFLYFQHNSNLTQNLGLFFSSEVDLYKRKNGIDQSSFDFTSLFILGSYSLNNWLNFSASYDARKNIVYYETYKNYADSVLESATRQGFSLRMNLRPLNYLWLGFNYGYRFSKDDPQPSRNYGVNLSYIQLPLILSSVYLSYNKIESGYVNGDYYSAAINKDLFNGEMNVGLGFKRVNYQFLSGSPDLIQNIGNLDLSWRLFYNNFLTISYEGTFQTTTTYSRIYLSLNTRF
mgnify:CR=1 FL=1